MELPPGTGTAPEAGGSRLSVGDARAVRAGSPGLPALGAKKTALSPGMQALRIRCDSVQRGTTISLAGQTGRELARKYGHDFVWLGAGRRSRPPPADPTAGGRPARPRPRRLVSGARSVP